MCFVVDTIFLLMKASSAAVLCILMCFLLSLSKCQESVDCAQFTSKQLWQVQFILVDKVTSENLLTDHEIQNPKKISIDSLALYNHDLLKYNEPQLSIHNQGSGAYSIAIYIFDQSKVPDVDVYTSDVITYYLYSGNNDYDTIVFDYSFQRGKYCYSVTSDTVNCYVNGKPASFSKRAVVKDIFAIAK